MSIEKNLERIATALESLAAGAVDLGVVVKAADAVVNNAATGKTPVQIAPAPILGDGVEEPPVAAKPPKRTRKPKSTPAPEAAPITADTIADPVTVDSVREALRIFLKDHKPAEARTILESFEATSVTNLHAGHYAAVLALLSA